MSLKFGAATSDRVSITDSTSNHLTPTTVFTWLALINLNTITGTRRIAAKNALDGNGGPLLYLSTTIGEFSGNYNGSLVNAFTTSSGAGLVTNLWTFIGMTYDTNDTPQCRLYKGTLTTPIKEMAYAAGTTVFSGTSVSSAALVIGNESKASPINALQGSIAKFSMFTRKLTVKQMISWQSNIIRSGAVVIMRLGQNGTATQPDISGNANHGTVTGAIMAPDPPLQKRLEYQKMLRIATNVRQTGYRWRADDGTLLKPVV